MKIEPPESMWDPFASLGFPLRAAVWGLFAVAAIFLQGAAFINSLRPDDGTGVDFFQDWASAKNFLEGLPVYTEHSVSIPRYLRLPEVTDVLIPFNAHPPTSVLVCLPFALLRYPDAVLAWNLCSLTGMAISLYLLATGLGIGWRYWSIFPLVVLILINHPLRLELILGQYNGLLILLLTLLWRLSREEKDLWAGIVLGFATVVKLYPGFFLIHFLLQGRWKLAGTAIVAIVALTGFTIGLLGLTTYYDYWNTVLPSVASYAGWSPNVSMRGFWHKLFDPMSSEQLPTVSPLFRSPVLTRFLTFASVSSLVAYMVMQVPRVKSQGLLNTDHAFGMSVAAMMLVSPITWDHYILLLMIPMVFLWVDCSRNQLSRILLLVSLIVILAPSYLSLRSTTDTNLNVWESLTLLSVHTYLLVGIFVWEAKSCRVRRGSLNGTTKK